MNIRKSLTEFEKGNLKHVETEEKNPLPDATGRTLSSSFQPPPFRMAPVLKFITSRSPLEFYFFSTVIF